MLFSSIPGHEVIKSKLLNACNHGRLPHAILLHGPEGNGGLALGLSIITYLLCTNPNAEDACGDCDNCSKTGSFIHPDVHYSFPTFNNDGSKTSDAFIKEWRQVLKTNPYMSYEDWMESIKGKDDQNKQGNITSEECREIIRKLSLMSYEGGKKFMLIWLPEFFGQSGNILLKLLEEPPADTHLILVAEDINQILPTIVSRTQIFSVPGFTPNAISLFLQKNHLKSEKQATAISFLSKGNLSIAKNLLDEEDTGYTETMQSWLQYCYARNTSKINEWVATTSAFGREKIKQFLENTLYIFGECLHCRFIEGHMPRVPEANAKFVMDISKILTESKIERIYRHINDTIYHIERNANPKISLFNLSMMLRNILLEK